MVECSNLAVIGLYIYHYQCLCVGLEAREGRSTHSSYKNQQEWWRAEPRSCNEPVSLSLCNWRAVSHAPLSFLHLFGDPLLFLSSQSHLDPYCRDCRPQHSPDRWHTPTQSVCDPFIYPRMAYHSYHSDTQQKCRYAPEQIHLPQQSPKCFTALVAVLHSSSILLANASVNTDDILKNGIGGGFDGSGALGLGGDTEGSGAAKAVKGVEGENDDAKESDEAGGGHGAEADERMVGRGAYDELNLLIGIC